jgi:hypothetical protein
MPTDLKLKPDRQLSAAQVALDGLSQSPAGLNRFARSVFGYVDRIRHYRTINWLRVTQSQFQTFRPPLATRFAVATISTAFSPCRL